MNLDIISQFHPPTTPFVSGYDEDSGPQTDPYLRMQFFNVRSQPKYYNLFSSDTFQSKFPTYQPGSDSGQTYLSYYPDVANWVESTNDWETHP